MKRARNLVRVSAALAGLSACAGEGTAPERSHLVELRLEDVPALDAASEGTYEGWVIGSDGTIASAGRFSHSPAAETVALSSPFADPEYFMLTVEPPGDEDTRPSAHKLMGGRFAGTTALLAIERYVTATLPLEPTPGTHVLATLSDNDGGNLANEEAGLWLFNVGGDTLDGSYYLDMTPLTEGWAYEGWIVRDFGSSGEIWISYGKFRPDGSRQCNARDDTGLGPFSGRPDYDRALPLTVTIPGDDWLTQADGVSLPGGLTLPLDLNGDAAAGVASRWTHVISVEPWGPNREAELPLASRPFFLRPYRNPIGEAPADQPRVIGYDPITLPRGTATIVPQ